MSQPHSGGIALPINVRDKRHFSADRYVYIGRPSKWGNPFVVGIDGTRAEVIQKYEEWLRAQPDLVAAAKRELAGKALGCYCKPQACHGDVLAKIVREQ